MEFGVHGEECVGGAGMKGEAFLYSVGREEWFPFGRAPLLLHQGKHSTATAPVTGLDHNHA